MIAGRYLQRHDACSGRNHLILGEYHAVLGKLVREPSKCDTRIAQDISAKAFALRPRADATGNPMCREIDAAPCLRSRGSEHELMAAGIVGDQLRSPYEGKVRIAR